MNKRIRKKKFKKQVRKIMETSGLPQDLVTVFLHYGVPEKYYTNESIHSQDGMEFTKNVLPLMTDLKFEI